ncbi:entericidin [Bordetella genomosp. 10]|uniref:Entericidin n=1 Tax=Bordetella genomosp. 10 TaxID=1416804 RepID=A0A261SL36_9BORD|nr:entericidin [Bordetella genomosp. 10]OZI38116.1 entericidin [Bordetella genomosp. 10]
MKNQTRVLKVAPLATCVLAGCNTIHGADKDIERGGENIQEQAR